MKRNYTKEDFENLDLDDKCAIIEELLTNDYYSGQTEINFFVSEGHKGEADESLTPVSPEIEKIEDQKFEQLIVRLTDKLFENKKVIEFDLEILL